MLVKLTAAVVGAVMLSGFGAVGRPRTRRPSDAERVRTEFMRAWTAYKRYAWGHDDLRPLSKTPYDWYGEPLLMTPVDALDTMIVMGFEDEAARTREYIATHLSFDRDIFVKNFEITIRLLGGLLSSYELTGDRRLLALAEDLGRRLLPAFRSPTGMPYTYVNLRTGATRQPDTNPAEIGTLLLEFGTLSKLTGNPAYFDAAKRAIVEVYKRRSPIGLVGQNVNVETGAWTNADSSVSAEIDSYYEYLYKGWLLFGDEDCRRMWNESIKAIDAHLADEVDGGLWYGHADMTTGRRTATTFGALDAFFPALLAVSGDVTRARRLEDSAYRMWRLNAVEPEIYDYRSNRVLDGAYHLRPEIVESAYYLHMLTRDPKYIAMGRALFDDFVRACRTDEAYAVLKDVRTKEKLDVMHSFLFAETFKYFYLLFAPDALRFERVVFNTEAHPLFKDFKAARRSRATSGQR